MRRFFFLTLFCVQFAFPFAQVPVSMTSAELYHAIKKLKVTGSVLYIAAHPDDENTRLLTYLAKDRMYRTGYLSITRGDGGQNLIGEEQGVELGLIRTQELLAARRIDGAEQFFTRAYDFGYSKSTDEALSIWGKENILSDVVWVIRQFQPDIIITRFPPDNRAGHGHHSASAVLAREAFEAAGDSSRFTDQFKYGVKPWKPKRIMWNTFNFGSSNTTSNDQFRIDVGGYNPLLGKSYGEIASESRSQHKSQGFGVPRQRGQQLEYFSPVAGDAWSTDIMDGIDASWNRVQGGKQIEQQLLSIEQNYRHDNPSASVPALINLYIQTEGLPTGYWRDQKLKEIKQVIELAAGLYFECSTSNPYAVRGDSLHLQVTAINRAGYPVTLKAVRLVQASIASEKEQNLSKDIAVKEKFDLLLPDNFPLSKPYWLEEEPVGLFNVTDQRLIGMPESAPSLEAVFSIVINNREFHFTKPVQYKFTDPVKGEIYWPLAVVPKFSLEVEPKVLISGRSGSEKAMVSVRAFSEIKTSGISIGLKGNYPESRQLISSFTSDSLMSADRELIVPLLIPREFAAGSYVIDAGERVGNSSESYHEITYDHIPRIVYFDKPLVKLISVDLKTNGKKIGYIKGAGDKVPDALKVMGYDVVMLEEKDMVPDVLRKMDAIVTGIRAYNVHKWLGNVYAVLMDYVNEGGVLVVQYNTSSQIGPLKSRFTPYPLTISRNRVSEENADVSFLDPFNPLFNHPNKISKEDFKGWIQERSVYEAEPFDSAYVSLLSMHDKGEPERKGSLLVTNYGKGKFIYTGLSLFRQLPAGVPGSYRLFANIIAGGRPLTKSGKTIGK